MPASWKTVRVFISSTFRDMHAERDHLVKVTFPRLRQWCEERRLHLDDIDLRWGITQEQAASGKVIELCLQVVDGCRPFFVCMLGNRYGLTPDQVPADKVAAMRGFEIPTDKSVTHLEILYAALWTSADSSNPPCEYAFFYFRDPRCIPEVESLTAYTPEQRVRHEATFFTKESNRARMLADLRETIRQRFGPPGRVFEYGGVWDPNAANPEDETLKGRLTGLEVFGDRVEADLKKAIECRFAEHLRDLGRQDPLTEERSYHEAFIESRLRRTGENASVYVPRPEVEAGITAYVHGNAAVPLVVTGAPGSGKSAALAHWARTHEAADGFFVLARFIGASPSSTNLHRLLANLTEELNQRFNLGETVPLDPSELRKKWPDLLRRAGECRRVVILLDALNQLDRSADPRVVDWIPRPLPPGVRMVVSALEEDRSTEGSSSARQRPAGSWLRTLRELDCESIRLRELSDDEQREIVKHVPSLRAKTLEKEQVRLLLSNPGTRNPLFLLVALEELRTFGSFEKLNAAIKALPRPDGTEAGIQAAVERMFGSVLARLERETDRFAPGLVRELFSLLAAAREGLSEEELVSLLRTQLSAEPEGAFEGEFQIVLRQVRPYLHRKGSQRAALVDFYHRSFWKAARNRYLADDASRSQRHTEIAAYFEGQPNEIDSAANERKAVELIWNRLRVLEAASAEAGPSLLSAWQPLERVLRDQELLKAKCAAGLTYELLEEYNEAYLLLGERRREIASRAIQGLLNLFLAHYGRNHPVLTPVALQSYFAYRTDDKEFYKALLQAANSPEWLEQVADPAAGEKLASEAAVDYCGLLRREGNVEEAENRLPAILRRMEEVGHFLALCRGEYEFAYTYFMRHDLEEAARIFGRSADHSFQATPPHTVGGWVSRCLQFRASYLARRTSAHEFRTTLKEAGAKFESHPGSDFARRWVMNYKAHLFEIAFAEGDAAGARTLLEGIEGTRWMQGRDENERGLRMLPYRARQAMLENDWGAAAAYFKEYLDTPNPVWNSKAGEALAREFLDYGIALAEHKAPEVARQVWQRGLDCPDELANKIWKGMIAEAQGILRVHGRCWPHLPRPLLR
jgi:Domain of unknown function (DUF4062)